MTGRSGAVAILAAFCAVALAAGDPPGRASTDAGGVALRLDAAGAPVSGVWWDVPAERGAGVVVLATPDAPRDAWLPLVPHLRARSLDVVLIDVPAGPPDGARAALRAAAKHLAGPGECSPTRIGVCGAGAGGLFALSALRGDSPPFAAGVALSPAAAAGDLRAGTVGLGLGAATPALVLCHALDAEGAVRALRDASPSLQVVVAEDDPPAGTRPDRDWARGTRMLAGCVMAPQTVASFLAARTASRKDYVVLDGHVGAEAGSRGGWARADHLSGSGTEAWAYLADGRVTFALRVPSGASGTSLLIAAMVPAGQSAGWRALAVADISLPAGEVTRAEGTTDEGGSRPPPGAATALRFVVRRTPGTFDVEGEYRLPASFAAATKIEFSVAGTAPAQPDDELPRRMLELQTDLWLAEHLHGALLTPADRAALRRGGDGFANLRAKLRARVIAAGISAESADALLDLVAQGRWKEPGEAAIRGPDPRGGVLLTPR